MESVCSATCLSSVSGSGWGKSLQRDGVQGLEWVDSLPDSPATEENPGEDPGPVSDPCGRRDRAVKSARSKERGARWGIPGCCCCTPHHRRRNEGNDCEAEFLSRRRALEGKSLLIALASQNLAEPNGSLSTLTHPDQAEVKFQMQWVPWV